jgi:hypothetical protein
MTETSATVLVAIVAAIPGTIAAIAALRAKAVAAAAHADVQIVKNDIHTTKVEVREVKRATDGMRTVLEKAAFARGQKQGKEGGEISEADKPDP